MTDPLKKSLRAFSTVFSGVGLLATAAVAGARAYPQSAPGAEYAQIVETVGLCVTGFCLSISGSLATISKMRSRKRWNSNRPR